jgi:hypothetical protein
MFSEHVTVAVVGGVLNRMLVVGRCSVKATVAELQEHWTFGNMERISVERCRRRTKSGISTFRTTTLSERQISAEARCTDMPLRRTYNQDQSMVSESTCLVREHNAMIWHLYSVFAHVVFDLFPRLQVVAGHLGRR